MAKERLQQFASEIQGITYPEWSQLKLIIDLYFNMKRGETERELRLTYTKELDLIIRSLFG